MRGTRKMYAFFLILVTAVFFGAAFTLSPPDAHADAIDNSIAELQGVYDKLNLDTSGKAAVNTARSQLASLNRDPATGPWPTVLSNLLTPQVVARFASEAQAKTAIINFVCDLATIQYSSSSADLRANLGTFKTNHASTVTALFGDITVNELLNLFLAAKTHIPRAITSNTTQLISLASGDYSNIRSSVVNWSKLSLNSALQGYPALQTKLTNIGWSTDSLVNATDRVSAAIDPSYAGEIAFAKAYVRAESRFLVGTSPLPATSSIALTVGGSLPCKLSILGFNFAGDVLHWETANPSIAKIQSSQIVGVSPGTTEVTVYNSNINSDWAYKGTVVVAAMPAPTFVSAATNLAGTVLSVTFSKAMVNPAGKHAQFTVLTNGAANPVTAAALNADTKKIDLTLTNPVVFGNTVTVNYTAGTVAAADSGLLATFAAQTVTIPKQVTTPTVTVDESSKIIAVTTNTPVAVTVTIPSNVTDAKVDVSALLNAPDPAAGTVTTNPLPAMEIKATTSVSATAPVEVAIPSGTTVTASAASNWDGTINAPTVKEVSSVTVTPDAGNTATVSTVIEIGFGDVPLILSKAVRILIPGQAGKEVGYSRGATFTKITRVMTADTQAAGDALPDGEEGKINVGTDLVVWTKHFTKFVSYTQTASGGVGGPGGAPASNKVEKTIQAGTATTASISGKIMVEIPIGAVTGSNASVVIEPMSDSKAEGAGLALLSPVMDVKLQNGSLSGKINITLYFDKNKLGKDQDPVAYYNSGSQWTRVNGNVDYDKQTVTLNVDHLTLFAVFAATKEAPKQTVSFNDLQDHWAQGTINKLAGMGAISGYPDGTFKPENSITRAEVTTILVKALNLKPSTDVVTKFADEANIPAWARQSVVAAVTEGIIKGYPQPDGTITFEADKPVTRAELAAMTANIITKKFGPVAPATLVFNDKDNIPAWAKAAVGTVVSKGVVSGYPDNTFKAENPITRAEAASIVLRLIELK